MVWYGIVWHGMGWYGICRQTKQDLGEMPVISGGPFIDITAPSVGSNFGLGIDDSCDTMDGARGGVGRSVLLAVLPEEDSRLSLVS